MRNSALAWMVTIVGSLAACGDGSSDGSTDAAPGGADQSALVADMTRSSADLTGAPAVDLAGSPAADLAGVVVDMTSSSAPDLATSGTCSALHATCTGAGVDNMTGFPLQGSCCSGFCVTPNGMGTTGTCCYGPNAACTSTAQCCMGGTCMGGMCVFQIPMCVPTGSACTAAQFCCASQCVDTSGTPVQGSTVGSCCTQMVGDSCTNNTSCCSGNCQSNGRCGFACPHLGQACTSGGAACCTGLICISGQCQTLCTITKGQPCTPGGACCANNLSCKPSIGTSYTCQQ